MLRPGEERDRVEAHHRPKSNQIASPSAMVISPGEEAVEFDDRRRLHPHVGDIDPPQRAAIGLLADLRGRHRGRSTAVLGQRRPPAQGDQPSRGEAGAAKMEKSLAPG